MAKTRPNLWANWCLVYAGLTTSCAISHYLLLLERIIKPQGHPHYLKSRSTTCFFSFPPPKKTPEGEKNGKNSLIQSIIVRLITINYHVRARSLVENDENGMRNGMRIDDAMRDEYLMLSRERLFTWVNSAPMKACSIPIHIVIGMRSCWYGFFSW